MNKSKEPVNKHVKFEDGMTKPKEKPSEDSEESSSSEDEEMKEDAPVITSTTPTVGVSSF
jgi:hypothetical protein